MQPIQKIRRLVEGNSDTASAEQTEFVWISDAELPAVDVSDVESDDNSTSLSVSRRRALMTIGATSAGLGVMGSATADPPDSANNDDDDDDGNFPEDGWTPSGIDPEDLTDKNRGQLVASIPNDAKDQIEDADIFAPMSVIEASQNPDRPEEDENGLVTYEENDDGILEFEFSFGDADDLEAATQAHIHHAPKGGSDNRLFIKMFCRGEFDGDNPINGGPIDDGLSKENSLDDQIAQDVDDSLQLDENRLTAVDPDAPGEDLGLSRPPTDEELEDLQGDDETIQEVAEDLSQAMLDSPTEFINNVHTVNFQTEAIRGQIRSADFGQLSRSELIETVLATGGLEALEGGPPGRRGKDDEDDEDDEDDDDDDEDDDDDKGRPDDAGPPDGRGGSNGRGR